LKPRRSTHRSPARFLGRVIEGAKPASFPGFVEPCNPTLRKTPPSGDEWLHEIKHDGYRAQVQFSDGVRIFTRRGHDWADRMPAIAAAVGALPVNNVILDGELVAVDAKGQAVFYELPAGLTSRPTRVKARLIYYAFDLLYLDGFDLRGAALIDRKRVLEALLDNARGLQLIKYVEHIEGDGAMVLEHACKLELEGIVSKRVDAPYRSGKRPEWIKTKCAAWREANRDGFELMGKKPKSH
jgi:bifunctional non-homologous end joining protein LigD